MENTKVLEALIATLRNKLAESVFRSAELETLLILEQSKNAEIMAEIEAQDSKNKTKKE